MSTSTIDPQSILDDIAKYGAEDLWTTDRLRVVRIGYRTHYKNVKKGGWRLLIVGKGRSIKEAVESASALVREPFGEYFGLPAVWGDIDEVPLGIRIRLAAFEGQIDLEQDRIVIPSTLTPSVEEWLRTADAEIAHHLHEAPSSQLFVAVREDTKLLVHRNGMPYRDAIDRLMDMGVLPHKGWKGRVHSLLTSMDYQAVRPGHGSLRPNAWTEPPALKRAQTTPVGDGEPASERTKAQYRDLLERLRAMEEDHPFPHLQREAKALVASLQEELAARSMDAETGEKRASDKQIVYIRSIADRLKIAVPPEVLASSSAAREFIGEHKERFDRARYKRHGGGETETTDAMPGPNRRFDALEDALSSYRRMAASTGWTSDVPLVDGERDHTYHAILANADMILRGDTLRGIGLRHDIGRHMHIGVRTKPAISLQMIFDYGRMFIAWRPGDIEDAAWNIEPTEFQRKSVLYQYGDFASLGAHPARDVPAPRYRPGAENIDAWMLVIASLSMAELVRRLESNFVLSRKPSLLLFDHPLREEGAPPLPWTWSFASPEAFERFEAEAIAAFDLNKAAVSQGVDMAIVAAEMPELELSRTNWPATDREAWALVRRWAKSVRYRPDPDPAAVVEEERVASDAKKTRAKEKAAQRYAITKAHRALADAILDATSRSDAALVMNLKSTAKHKKLGFKDYLTELVPQFAIDFDIEYKLLDSIAKERIAMRAAKKAKKSGKL